MPSSVRLDELQQKFDENPRRYFAPLANELRKSGDARRAIDVCRAHLAQQPGHMSGHVVLAQAHHDLGEWDEAQRIFHHALELDPENVLALQYLGDIAQARGEWSAAREFYTRILAIDPRNPSAHARVEQLEAGQETVAVSAPPSSSHSAADELPSPAAELATSHDRAPDEGAGERTGASVDEALVGASDWSAPWGEPSFESAASSGFAAHEGYGDPEEALRELEAQFQSEEFTAGFFAEVIESDTLQRAEPRESAAADLAAAAPVEAEELAPAMGGTAAEVETEPGTESQPRAETEAELPTPLADDAPAAAVVQPPAQEVEADWPTAVAEATEGVERTEAAAAGAQMAVEHDDQDVGEERPELDEPTHSAAASATDDSDDAAAWDVSPVEPADELHGQLLAVSERETPGESPAPAVVAWSESSPPAEEIPAAAAAAEPSAAADADWFADTAEYVAPAASTSAASTSDADAREDVAEWPAGSPEPSDSGASEPSTTEVGEPTETTAEVAGETAQAEAGTDEHADADADADVAQPGEAREPEPASAATAFVTETMAQLYVRQGLHEQALAMYRQLVERQPDDEGLRERMEQLQLASGVAAAGHAPDEAPAAGERPAEPTVGSWLRRLATAPVAAIGAAPLPAAPDAAPVESLDELLRRPVPSDEEQAAGALVAATLSLQADAGIDAQLAEQVEDDPSSLERVLRATPSSVAALRQGMSFSFEQFFRGTPAGEPGAAPAAAPRSPSATPAAPAESAPSAPESGSADLEDFHAWLSGLSKS